MHSQPLHLPRLDPLRLDLVVAILLTVAAEAQILAGGTATGLVLAPALVAPAITLPVAVRRPYPVVVAVWMVVLAAAQIAIWGDPQVVGVTVAYLCGLYGLAVWASLAEQLGVETPVMDALVKLGLVVTHLDGRPAGRGARELGLAGMSVQEMTDYVS